jgi:hypothetical protein
MKVSSQEIGSKRAESFHNASQSQQVGKGSIFHHTLSNTRGRLWLSSLSLRSDVQMSWTWKTAPKRLKQLKMQYPGTPEFITVVPRAMQDSHFPPTAVEVFEVMDGFVVYE